MSHKHEIIDVSNLTNTSDYAMYRLSATIFTTITDLLTHKGEWSVIDSLKSIYYMQIAHKIRDEMRRRADGNIHIQPYLHPVHGIHLIQLLRAMDEAIEAADAAKDDEPYVHPPTQKQAEEDKQNHGQN